MRRNGSYQRLRSASPLRQVRKRWAAKN